MYHIKQRQSKIRQQEDKHNEVLFKKTEFTISNIYYFIVIVLYPFCCCIPLFLH